MGEEGQDYLHVESGEALTSIVGILQKETAIAVDLEADSMFHYQEKVCLLQFSTPSKNILVDPLAVKDLSPLAPIFKSFGICKIFHGADYDIRSLYRDFKIEVNALFDTQIAARFLGLTDIGLASLLQGKLNITLKKKYQKKDWSQRPLPAPMLQYAVHDTCHLIPLAQNLREELVKTGRLPFVEEECQLQTTVRSASPGDEPLFLKFNGAGKLDRRSLAVLEAILQYRDRTARRRDVPLFKVMGNAQVMALAKQKPVRMTELKHIKGLSHKQAKQLGEGILKSVRHALKLPEKDLPLYPQKRSQRIGPKVGERVKRLKQWRDQRGDEMGVDPALICTNAQAKTLALLNPRAPEDIKKTLGIKNWQQEEFGDEICAVLKGQG
ncbi:putative ribonuclease D [delta proteobacterium NaphS2]|nr:putative ribonuclease D [delta proteobacterium NaphS2]